MHQCVFKSLPTALLKKNDNLGIKNESGQFVFELGGITFRSNDDVSGPKVRITLQHKETGELLTFDDTKTLNFLPDIEKLKSKESGNKKNLKEQEKNDINIEPTKGNKLDHSYMDVTLNGNFSISSLSNLIDESHRIKLSSIAPKEVLDSLKSEAESVMGLTINQIEKLKSSLSFHPSVLDLIKRWPSFELHKMQLAILLEYLIRFLSLPIKNVRSKEPILGCPDVTTKFIVMNFTKEILNAGGKSKILMPKEEKDKLFLIIIALCGYLSNYEFPVSNFVTDIKASRDRIKKFGLLIDMRMIFVNKEHVMKSMKPYMIDDVNI